ncbi:MAG: S8 family serine peptidase [Candidatus Aminicenantales bacterium]
MDIRGRYCEFESAGSTGDILSHYDPISDTWDLPKEGEFWEAVKHAHEAGRRGAGCRIAVIDSSCDFSISRIRQQTGGRPKLPGPHDEATDHGTLVTLLVGLVAPECEIDVYEVSRNGRPDINAVVRAIQLAIRSDADIICLSLGSPTELIFEEEARRAFMRRDVITISALSVEREGLPSIQKEDPPCDLCRTTSQARAAGKMVFAAVGNDAGAVFCPACSPDVVAVGFQLVERSVEKADYGGEREVAFARPPSYEQTLVSDTSVVQIKGALGSSFACPLKAGAAALGMRPDELEGFVASGRLSAIADALHPFLGYWNRPELVNFVGQTYLKAIQRHPHRHMEPGKEADCTVCSLFSVPLYTNGGLFFLSTGELTLAESLLRAARRFAPWSFDAAANLGRTLQACAEKVMATSGDSERAREMLDEAIRHYREALALRPDFGPYQQQLFQIQRLREQLSY